MGTKQRKEAWLRRWRTGLWHLRKGGLQQYRRWRLGAEADLRNGSAGMRVRRFGGRKKVSFQPLVLPDASPRYGDVTAAVILDEFSQMAWGYEFNTVILTPQRWREQLAGTPVDLLFVESAWHGNRDAWQYHLAGSSAPRPALKELVAHCRKRGIPTVFWNKEDPPHFEDFIETAALFDQVFTTDVNLLEAYRERLGHDRVGVLPFAAQEAVHNPIRLHGGTRVRDVAFGGMYFAHKFPERRAQMDLLLGGALDASRKLPLGLEIFSRFLGNHERYQFPPEFADRVVGSLSYEQMLTAYKAYKVFLNVNSVVDSPSMCSRRVFEILACGTPVVTTRSAAIPNFFSAGQVPIVDTREEAANTIRALARSPELAERMVHLAQREIWAKHTYGHRAADVLRAIGRDSDALRLPRVSAMVSTNRPHQIDHALASVAAQLGVEVQLVLITHGFEVDRAELRARAGELGITDVAYATMDASAELGACLRRAVELADGEIATKMDDDDLYGPHYLLDLLYARRFSGADVVGKHAHYMYLAGLDLTMRRFAPREHRWSHMVMGPTITASRELFVEIPFADRTIGEDSDWLRRVAEAGARIYAADRYNFVQMRHGQHTWAMSDWALLATGEMTFAGDPRSHVFL